MGTRSFVGAHLAGAGSSFNTTEVVAPVNSYGLPVAIADESFNQFKIAVAGDFDRPGMATGSTAGTGRTTTVRVGGTAALSWAITDGLAGAQVDSAGAAGAATVSVGDLVTLGRYTTASTANYNGNWANFVSPTTAVTLLASSGYVNFTSTGYRLAPISGFGALFTDGNDNAKTLIDVTGTISGCFINVEVNTKTADNTWELYVNDAATGVTITVPAGTTGIFEPVGTLSASITAGQNAYWRGYMTTTGSLTFAVFGCTLQATAGEKSLLIARAGTGASRTGSATVHYAPILARFGSTGTNEDLVKVKLGFAARLSNLSVLTGTAGYDAVFTVRVNGVDTGLTVTQLTGAAGWAIGGSPVTVTATDDVSLSWTGGTSGTTSGLAIVITVEDVEPRPTPATFTGGSTVVATMAGRAAITSGSTVAAVQGSPSSQATFSGGSTVSAAMAGVAGITSGSSVAAVQYVPPPPLEGLVQTLTPSARIELFELDATILGGTIYRFHAGVNGLMQPVVWAGDEYSPFPVQATGFEYSGQGPLPRPKFRVANVAGVMSSLVMLYDDLAGCKVTRIRTMAKFLDAVNFPSGNPDADPEAEYPREIYYIDRKSSESRDVVEFELSSSLDMAGVMFPSRQVVQNYCPWAYRGAECGYTGTDYFDTNDQVVAVVGQDVCGKRLSSCRARFGQYGELPYGGFPAAGLLRF